MPNKKARRAGGKGGDQSGDGAQCNGPPGFFPVGIHPRQRVVVDVNIGRGKLPLRIRCIKPLEDRVVPTGARVIQTGFGVIVVPAEEPCEALWIAADGGDGSKGRVMNSENNLSLRVQEGAERVLMIQQHRINLPVAPDGE